MGCCQFTGFYLFRFCICCLLFCSLFLLLLNLFLLLHLCSVHLFLSLHFCFGYRSLCFAEILL
ncbi:hypothetical protein FML17_18345 [Klebsiella michiganensis]|nr:hypothetical protein [Klebsiella michiganensis]